MASLMSERLRGLSFMKRREERDLRGLLAAERDRLDDKTKAVPNSRSSEKDATSSGEKVTPIVVVESMAEIERGTPFHARSGRRSYQKFNAGLEAANEAARKALERAARGDKACDDGEAKVACEEHAQWREQNVTFGRKDLGINGKKDPLVLSKAIRKSDKTKRRNKKLKNLDKKAFTKQPKTPTFLKPTL